LLLAAPKGAYGLQGPHPLASHSPMLTPQEGCRGCATSDAGPSGIVTYHGGPVMHSPTNYVIFWLPSGYHFDTPALDVPYVNASDANYESLIDRYLRDVSDTSLYSVLQQYTDSAGAPGLSAAFGGAWVDAAAYPNSEGTRSNPIEDSDIQGAVTAAMAANHWPAENGTNEFFVFTGDDVYSCGGQECSYNGYCSYHSAFGAADGETVIYAYIPDPGNANIDSCLATSVTGLPAPNGAAFADSAVNLVAHEEFESVTDPQFNGWFYQDVQHEIADECVWQFGQLSNDGSNINLNGHEYLVQEMWSDRTDGCYAPASVVPVSVTASYNILGGDPGYPSASTLTYWSGGVLRTTNLTTSPTAFEMDGGTVWNATGTLAAPSPTERWQTSQPTSGTASAGESIELLYYHQYLKDFQFNITGGGSGYSPPSVEVVRFGTSYTVGGGTSSWADAGSAYSYSPVLPGPSSSERWENIAPNNTVTGQGLPDPKYYHEYLVGFTVVDASGSHVLHPSTLEADQTPAINSDVRTYVQDGQAWLDAGSAYTVTKVIWGGVDVTPAGVTFTVEGQSNFTVVARVYDVSLKVTDYLGLPVPGASVHITLVNGTAITKTTDGHGTISLPSVPLGGYDASMSSLGFSLRTSASTPEEGGQTHIETPWSVPDVGTSAVILLLVLASAYYVIRRRRMYWL